MAVADTTKPVLTSLSFPTSVDVTSGGKNFTFTAGATDSGLGVSYVSVLFDKSWQNGSYNVSSFSSYDSNDSYSDGFSSTTNYIDPKSGAGTYAINSVYVYDKAGNSNYYNASQLTSMGIATSFEIKSANAADTTKPVLTSLSFPMSVDVTSGGKNFTFTAGATDSGLGVSYVSVLFDKSWQNGSYNVSSFSSYDSNDSYSDGLSSTTNYIDPKSGAGTYAINSVYVYDKAGNSNYYNASQLTSMGIATSFEIIDKRVGPTASVTTTGVIGEGTGSSLTPVLTLQNVSSYSGSVTLAFDPTQSTMTANEVNLPSFNGSYSVSQSPAGNYTINLPTIGAVDDLVIEGDETLAFKVTASGQIFASGSDNTIVKVTVKDNDRAGTVGADHMEGDAGNNYLTGLAGDDIINGNDGNDWLVGGKGHDRLNGGSGDDRLEPGEGNNVVDGGLGSDTLILAGAKSTYSLTMANGATYLVGEEGASRIVGVEQVSFAGEVLAVDKLAATLQPVDGLRYAASYADLSTAFGSDPQAALSHYTTYGFAEGRDAKGFDPLTYIASNPDLISAFGSNSAAAERHYIQSGRGEGRSVDSFDGLQYAASYPDIATAFGTDTEASARHYIENGKAEGRSGDSFDGLRYVASNPDLISTLGTNDDATALQYIGIGRSEGRSLNSFDALQYAASYGDIAAAFGTNVDAATRHYVEAGYSEGRAADSFDGLRYIASNPDLIVAFGDDDDAAAWHYVTAGRTEGRGLNVFDAQAYGAANPDLRAAFGSDELALTEHYIEHGYFEHRSLSTMSDLFLV